MADTTAYMGLAAAKLRSITGSWTLFVMRCIGDVLLVTVEALAPLVLVSRFGSIAGWRGTEVAMLIGIGRAGEGLALVFGRGVDPTTFGETVRLGRFDQVLTRPVSPLGWLLATELELRFVFRTLAGAVVIGWCAHRAGVTFSAAHVLTLLGAIVASGVLILAILVMGAALTFVTIEGSEVANLFSNGGIGLTSYPLDLYNSALRFAFTFVLPIGLCVYIPVVSVLDRHGPGILGPSLLPAVPVVLMLFVGVAALAWRAGLRHYQSTGS